MEKLTIEQFTVNCSNREETLQLKSEIFTHHCYYFETDSPTPYIIDAGAHIGLTTLYFKRIYPEARITAIEPHPETFKLLNLNITENGLTDVTTINAALARESGYKQLHADNEFNWHSTVSVHAKAWNFTQVTTPFVIQAIPLSELILQPVDLLKMDIEGAEVEVLLPARKHLKNVERIICEFHPTSRQSLQLLEFLKFLNETGFTCEVYQNGKTIDPERAHGLVLIEAVQW